MDIENCPDLPKAQERWKELWAGTTLSTPLLQIEVPRPDRIITDKPYPIRPDRDEQTYIDQVLAWADSHIFLGDSVPFYKLISGGG